MDFRNGLPKPRGASDYADSAHAAGMLATFGSVEFDASLLNKYFQGLVNMNSFVRNPDESPANNPLNFTRDQSIPLCAGFKSIGNRSLADFMLKQAIYRKYRAQNVEADVPGSVKKFPNGPDILTPSVMNHYRICANEKPKLLGKIWLVMDILFNAIFTPLSEPNNMIVMSLTAGKFYTKLMRITNRKLDAAIKEYWSGWRNEPELAQLIIDKINSI